MKTLIRGGTVVTALEPMDADVRHRYSSLVAMNWQKALAMIGTAPREPTAIVDTTARSGMGRRG